MEPERFAAWLATRSRTRRITRLPKRATMSATTTTIRMLSGRTIRSVTVDAVSGLTPNLIRRWYSQPPPWSTWLVSLAVRRVPTRAGSGAREGEVTAGILSLNPTL